MNTSSEDLGALFQGLVAVMEQLRGPLGCPWDREQTIESVAPFVLEEAYEVADAVASSRNENLCEELGDLLLQIVFIGTMAREKGLFDLGDVCRGITDKLIFRHPHIFGEMKADTSGEVIDLWDKMKKLEKQSSGVDQTPSALDGVRNSLPGLTYAFKLQKKAAKVGFDWSDHQGVVDKVIEEAEEIRESIATGSREDVEGEIGDLLFTAVNIARFMGVDPEGALRRSTDKFVKRFRIMEKAMKLDEREITAMGIDEMDIYWERAKSILASEKREFPAINPGEEIDS
ncbi:MAG: nucleoside triphosphate pyrophosphohydrolase [Candidatus Wallbacteria bacterium HGW-Wallbacteria-1]|uniref:Nucleoside triphosphate pyrophosphohydrolase n=1 Tax=Candidatus Wallbacteria bacterium HGW-Wallbacteria-1 TaxID=2013854 RepID=A0A2N1PU12_9BACT|nr:MAG: nucleoside triphosphate pyrophosphohydrolase [Candidatus Wallbacteria bacterium HGW-Wallbacteria-1]